VLLSDYILQVQELVHDVSSIDFSTQEMTNYVNNARKRVALDFHCVRQYFTGFNLIPGQETYPLMGGCGAVVTAGGLYSITPTVTFGPPPAGGVTATGVAVMSGTAPSMTVIDINLTNWGSGYVTTAIPTITFSSGAATATATPMANVFDWQSVDFLFGTQRGTLQWRPWTYFNAIFRSNTALSGPPACWSNYTEQLQCYFYAIPDQTYNIGIDAVMLPNPLINTTDFDSQIIDPPADAVQYYAAYLALLKLQNFGQADYYEKTYIKRVPQLQVTKQTRRVPNIYQNVLRRMQRGY
jgi:hypothetical protein